MNWRFGDSLDMTVSLKPNFLGAHHREAWRVTSVGLIRLLDRGSGMKMHDPMIERTNTHDSPGVGQ